MFTILQPVLDPTGSSAYLLYKIIYMLIQSIWILIGSQGVKGDPGITGSKGEPGIKGASGELGLAGEKGSKGERGPIGTNGNNGAKGESGEPGESGTRGRIGTTGDVGYPFQYDGMFVYIVHNTDWLCITEAIASSD